MYYADIPDVFEPNEPYCVGGFNLGDELLLEITDIRDDVVYDMNVPTGAIELSIPETIFCALQLCQINFSGNSTAWEGQNFQKILSKKFIKANYEGKQIRAVVLLPDIRVTNIFSKAIQSWINALEQLETSYVVLSYYDVIGL